MPELITFEIRVSRSAEAGIRKGFDTFRMALEPRMTVLDALFEIQRHHDASLSFRCACRVGMCGTCAVSVNGLPQLACKTRAAAPGRGTLTVEPLPHLPVIKDLVVSLDPFFQQWKQVLPAFRPKHPESRELASIPEDSTFARAIPRKRDCITCGACFAACGVKATSGEYLGPAAINKAFLRLMDPRDQAKKERAALLNDERSGVWRCHAQFNCVSVCPKNIDLADSIARLKRALLFPQRLART
ncbi:MAG: succinate dehydrogenase/fumarate reductase iron-sulfur subunit [Acidobacteria bacterium]|nr:succinate dehydrogenase/fumarate reductase iron-sulfur subunit [Acidobacteriota bacterium]